MAKCILPPPGWYCTRDAPHEGPCAALPIAEPANFNEYLTRFHENSTIFGRGLDTGMEMPCPFCAAPHFMRYRIVDTREVLKKGAVCGVCLRGARCIFQTSTCSATLFELVQTSGPDAPDWLVPAPRRI